MNSKPLSLDCLKSVLLNLDPNKRLLLSLQCPSIHALEKTVPLKIDTLKISDYEIGVNGTKYKCEIYQMNCCKNKPPYRVSGYDEDDDWVHDVNKFGVPDYGFEKKGSPWMSNGNEKLMDNECKIKELEYSISVEKQKCVQLLNFRPKNEENDGRPLNWSYGIFENVHARGRLYTDKELELLPNEERRMEAISFVNEQIDLMEKQLIPYENMRDNIEPRFEVHLIKEEGDSSTVVKRIKYTGDLKKDSKTIWELMLSKRQHVVVANEFIISTSRSTPLPCELKISTTKFKKDMPDEHIKSTIDLSGLPFEKMLPFLMNLVNQKVYLYDNYFFTNEIFALLIRSWVETKKPRGTCFIFEMKRNEKQVEQLFDFLCDHINGAFKGNKLVFIPMENLKAIKITYEQEKSSMRMAVVALRRRLPV
uniref:F-box domain-containing protein n=1 Tax=Caenorhabditis tropicalis TaxID=1561998 RepID=A0A1I7TMV3_9PELO